MQHYLEHLSYERQSDPKVPWAHRPLALLQHASQHVSSVRQRSQDSHARQALTRPKCSLMATCAAILLLLLLDLSLSACSSSAVSQSDAGDLQQATIVRVVDGDTLMVNLDGKRERVRLIGINCPESVAPEKSRNTQEGAEASSYTKSLVEAGDVVWLESDTNDRDQYDRLLRYVWLEQPEDVNDKDEIAGKMLNGILVREGYAQARRYGEDDLHVADLKALGKEAQSQHRGVTYLWE